MNNPWLIYTAFILFGVGYPIIASRYAEKRGRKGWSRLAFFSIMTVFLGPIIGTIAFLVAYFKPIEQVVLVAGDAEIKSRKSWRLCPNCESNSFTRTVMVRDPLTGEKSVSINQSQIGLTSGAVFIFLGLGVFGYGLSLFVRSDMQISYLVPAGVGLLAVWTGSRPWMARTQEQGRRKLLVYNCNKCKHTWEGQETG